MGSLGSYSIRAKMLNLPWKSEPASASPPLTTQHMQEELQRFAAIYLQPKFEYMKASIEDTVRREMRHVCEELNTGCGSSKVTTPRCQSHLDRAVSGSGCLCKGGEASALPDVMSLALSGHFKAPAEPDASAWLGRVRMTIANNPGGEFDGGEVHLATPCPSTPRLTAGFPHPRRPSRARPGEHGPAAQEQERLLPLDSIESEERDFSEKVMPEHYRGVATWESEEDDFFPDSGANHGNTLRCIVENPLFDSLFTVVILTNMLFMGMEADAVRKDPDLQSNPLFHKIDMLFSLVFYVEIVLRLGAYRMEFFVGDMWKWNILDLALIIMQTLDNFQAFLPMSCRRHSHYVLFRVLRVLRNIRILRVVRMCRFVAELRVLLVVMAGSFQATLWTIILLATVTYAFGLVLVNAINDSSYDPHEFEELNIYFGSMGDTMWVLYMTITNGIQWNKPADVLSRAISPWAKIMFGAYVAFMSFAFLNIISGIFLHTAMATTDDMKHSNVLAEMKKLFQHGDRDRSGALTQDELEELIASRELGTYFQGLGWRPEQALELFKIIDVDESGTVSIEEFISGCTRLQGATKAVDFAAYVHEFERVTTRMLNRMSHMEAILSNAKAQGCLDDIHSSTARPEFYKISM